MHRRTPSRLASGLALLLLVAAATDAQPEAAPPPRPAADPGPPLPKGAVARIGQPRMKFPGAVINVAFAPTGTTFVTTANAPAGGNKSERLVVLWDAATGREIREFHGHEFGVEALAFSADGTRIVTAGRDRTVRLWRVDTGTEVHTFTGHTGTVLAVDCSPDGKRVVSEAQDETVRIWDVATGDEVRQLPGHKSNGTSNLKYSPDGKALAAVGADFAVRLWDPDTGNEIKRFTGPTKDCESLDFSRDGKRLAAISDDGRLWVWDVATGKELVRVQAHTGTGKAIGICVRFSPDGTLLATGGADGLIQFWDSTGKRVRTATGHPGNLVSEISFSADGSVLASASHEGTAKLWYVATAVELPQSGGTAARVALSPDGKRLATSSGGPLVRFWDPATGKEPRPPLTVDHPVGALAFTADGRTLITTDSADELQLWDIATGQRVRQVGVRTGTPAARLAVGPGGRFVVTAGGSTLAFWDTATWVTAAVGVTWQPPVRSVAFAPGDGRVAVGQGDGRVHLWNLATKKVEFAVPAVGPGPGATAVAWSPDGRTFASIGAADSSLWLWEAATGRERLAPVPLPGAWSVAFSPGGRLLAVGGAGGFLHLYDAWTGRQLAERVAGAGTVSFLAFTPDGRFLVTAATDVRIPTQKGPDTVQLGDGTALVWDVAALVKDAPAVPKPTAAEANALWDTLRGDDPHKAHDAVWRLAAAPEVALPLLRNRLPKVKPEESDQRVKKLLADLDDDDFDVREKATNELIRLGSSAIQEVRQELAATKSREVKRRTQEIVAKVGAATATRPVAVLLARGTEVLQRLGTAEARTLLEEWAKGPAGAPLTVEAKAALSLLGKPR